MVGYEANKTQKSVSSFSSKIQRDRGTRTGVLVAPKGPSYVFSPWEVPNGEGGLLYKYHFLPPNTMLLRPNRCQWTCQLAHTSCEQARFQLCTSSRVVDYFAILIVGRRGVYTSLMANGFALLMGHFGPSFGGGVTNQGLPGVLAATIAHSAHTAQVPPPPCPRTTLRKNQPLVPRSNSRITFFTRVVGFSCFWWM